MDNNKMILEYEDGVSIEVEIMGVFDVDGTEYIALEDPKTDDVYLYGYIDKGDSFELEDIPDDKYGRVEKTLHDIMNSKA